MVLTQQEIMSRIERIVEHWKAKLINSATATAQIEKLIINNQQEEWRKEHGE